MSSIEVPRREEPPHQRVAARGVDGPVEHDSGRKAEAGQDDTARAQESRRPEPHAVADERPEMRAPGIDERTPELHAYRGTSRILRVGGEDVAGDGHLASDDAVPDVDVVTEE